MSQTPNHTHFETFDNSGKFAVPSQFRGAHILGETQPITAFTMPEQARPAPEVLPVESFDMTGVEATEEITHIEESRDVKGTWEHAGVTFKDETPPDFSLTSFEEIMKDPRVRAQAQEYLGSILSGNVKGVETQPLELETPYFAERDDIEPIAPLQPHQVDVEFMTEQTTAARGQLQMFDQQAERFEQSTADHLRLIADQLVSLSALHIQFSEWRETASSNNANLDRLLVEQQAALVAQAEKCDELFMQGEIIEGQLDMFAIALEDAGVKAESIRREIDAAQANSDKVQRRYHLLNERTKQLIELKDIQKSTISESDVKMFLGEEIAAGELGPVIRQALENPRSDAAGYVRQLIVGSFTGTAEQIGFRQQLLENSRHISEFIRLKHSHLENHDVEVQSLLAKQAELGHALAEHVINHFNPALEELAAMQHALTESQALARQRVFAATSIPKQLEAVQRKVVDTQRTQALQLEASTPKPRHDIHATDRRALGSGETTRAARREVAQQSKGFFGTLGRIARRRGK